MVTSGYAVFQSLGLPVAGLAVPQQACSPVPPHVVDALEKGNVRKVVLLLAININLVAFSAFTNEVIKMRR
jgi:hypothetical protein